MPGFSGSVGWTSPTSCACCSGPIPYVSGFQAGLTASKRFDPLVAFAERVLLLLDFLRFAAGTTTDPSDVIGTRLGASLAVTTSHVNYHRCQPQFSQQTQSGEFAGAPTPTAY